MEYFVNFQDIKTLYYGYEECVDAISPVGLEDFYTRNDKESECSKERSEWRNCLRRNDVGSGFVKYLIQCQQEMSLNQEYKRTELRLDLIEEIGRRVPQKDPISNDNCDVMLDASILVGQSIRLYCNIDNIYHTGR